MFSSRCLGGSVLVAIVVVAAEEGSCKGRCGTWARSCWCNSACQSRGDCCADYQQACQGQAQQQSSSCPKCPGNSYNCDEWIAWAPSKYNCQNLLQDWGCNCTGCRHCQGPAPVPAGLATLTLLDRTAYPEARCLDGSQAGYYMRRGPEQKVLIFLAGGGWCYDPNCKTPTIAGTLADCHRRAKTQLGSSRSWRPTQHYGQGGILSANPTANPVFHNWTLVYVPYCDGTSFSGDAKVDGLHFKGRAVLQAVLDQLKRTTDIELAEQVVVTGGSAGASAVFYHIDSIAEQLGVTEVLGLPDAGFFLDMKDQHGIDCWPAQMRSLFNVSNAYAALHRGCLQRFPVDKWKCMFPEYYIDLIRSRMFLLNSLYDSSELEYTLRLKCCLGGCNGGAPPCKGKALSLVDLLRRKHMELWAPLTTKRGNGIWAPACVDHTLSVYRWTNTSWEVPAHSGVTQAVAVQRWLSSMTADCSSEGFVFQDDQPWPSNRPCAGAGAADDPSLYQ